MIAEDPGLDPDTKKRCPLRDKNLNACSRKLTRIDTGKVFPIIRFFGTFGWIIAGLVIGSNIILGQKFGLGLEASNSTLPYTFYIASGASILLGMFSFTLPDVPPKGKSDSSSFGLEALVLLKDKSYLIFFVSAVLICIPLSFYYSFANVFLKVETNTSWSIGSIPDSEISLWARFHHDIIA